MYKVIANWSGFPGAPGVSNFYFSVGGTPSVANVANAQGRIRTFFAAFTLCLPTGVTISISGDSQVIDPATGAITGTVSNGTPPANVAGAGGTFYSALSGACVIWKTSVVINSRQLRGKTFLVPLTSAAYDNDGTLLASRRDELRAAAAALVLPGAFPSDELLVVWHRPTGGAGGSAALANASSVNDRVAYLKSRRA
jgi:hypothetical protein